MNFYCTFTYYCRIFRKSKGCKTPNYMRSWRECVSGRGLNFKAGTKQPFVFSNNFCSHLTLLHPCSAVHSETVNSSSCSVLPTSRVWLRDCTPWSVLPPPSVESPGWLVRTWEGGAMSFLLSSLCDEVWEDCSKPLSVLYSLSLHSSSSSSLSLSSLSLPGGHNVWTHWRTDVHCSHHDRCYDIQMGRWRNHQRWNVSSFINKKFRGKKFSHIENLK